MHLERDTFTEYNKYYKSEGYDGMREVTESSLIFDSDEEFYELILKDFEDNGLENIDVGNDGKLKFLGSIVVDMISVTDSKGYDMGTELDFEIDSEYINSELNNKQFFKLIEQYFDISSDEAVLKLKTSIWNDLMKEKDNFHTNREPNEDELSIVLKNSEIDKRFKKRIEDKKEILAEDKEYFSDLKTKITEIKFKDNFKPATK